MNYSTLKTVANLFNVIGVLQIVATIFTMLIVISKMYYPEAQIMVLAGGILCCFLSVFWFAFAQLIKLFINAADHIETTNNNVYVIATKVEEYFNNVNK